jgi:hypothetical protein
MSVWTSTKFFSYRSDVLHLLDTGEEMGVHETVHHLFIDYKKAYNSIIRGVFSLNLVHQ